jgi:hypothetical protein
MRVVDNENEFVNVTNLYMISVFLASLVNAQVPAPTYGACSATNYRYSSVQGRSFTITPALTRSPITVSGEVAILDGCRFRVQNFVFINGGESYWYGGNRGNPEGITASDTNVTPSAFPANFTYELTRRVGAEANFNGFNQLRLFERHTNVVIATVDFPDAAAPAPTGATSPSSTPLPSTPETNTNGTPETVIKSGVLETTTTVGTILGAIAAFFFA